MKKIIISIMILLILTISGCTNNIDKENAYKHIPTGATLVSDKGNGWIIFEMDGMIFLYHKSNQGYKGYECLTKLN